MDAPFIQTHEFPRYFLSDGTPALPLPAPEATPLAEVLAALSFGDARNPQSAVVVRDLGGRVLLASDTLVTADPTLRPAVVHAEFARNGQPPRYFAAQQLWMMTVQLAELPIDGDTVAAPVQLHGTLYGPFGPAIQPVEQSGRLSVRRADWLFGVLAGVGAALVSGPERDDRVCCALVPGGPQDCVVAGTGLVLAFPLLPVGVSKGNAMLITQLLAEALANVQEALRATGSEGPFAQSLVPVLDRSEMQAKLVAQGFAITGDVAVKSALFGRDGRLELPKVGALQDFVDNGELALRALGQFGYPDSLARTLHGRVGSRPTVVNRQQTANSDSNQQTASSKPQTASSHSKPRQQQPKQPPDWLADFADLPSPPERAKMPALPTAPSTPPVPDWLKDFE